MVLGQIVYLKTDREQQPRMLTEALLTLGGSQLKLTCGTVSSWHYEAEISEVRDELFAMDINQTNYN